jgi:hypothetical protein
MIAPDGFVFSDDGGGDAHASATLQAKLAPPRPVDSSATAS